MFSKRLEAHELPSQLFDLPDPPSHLYLVGKLPPSYAIAIVGTRRPTAEAITFTGELVRALGAAKVAIWSGGAEGIDAEAHRAAMRSGLPTVVVAPAGWARPYPPQHAPLFREIVARDGAYLSIVEDQCVAKQHRFFARNAVLAALVQVVIVIQAGLRSGARNAAKFARQLGRPLYAVPSCPWTHQGLGCNLEIALGAKVLTSASDLLLEVEAFQSRRTPIVIPEIGPSGRRKSTAPQVITRSKAPAGTGRTGCAGTSLDVPNSELSDAVRAELNVLLAMIRTGANNVEILCTRTGLPASVVQSDLLRLTLLGLIRTDRTGMVTSITH